jgi:hypothetical protein
MQNGCKVYVDCHMASTGPCFMVTWTILENHGLLEVGLTQNGETMALLTLTSIDLLYEDPHE